MNLTPAQWFGIGRAAFVALMAILGAVGVLPPETIQTIQDNIGPVLGSLASAGLVSAVAVGARAKTKETEKSDKAIAVAVASPADTPVEVVKAASDAGVTPADVLRSSDALLTQGPKP